MVVKVGINGFGRIGRVVFRTCLQNQDISITAINDPAIDIEYICYLIKFDSTHGKLRKKVCSKDSEILIDDHKIKIFREKYPRNVPWQTAEVQYVIEASGMFTNLDKAQGHLASDCVKRVIVTAPSIDVPMLILGVNDNKLSTEHKVLSCASSTLYCLAPIIKVLNDHYGVVEGFMTSIHAMTPSLKPLDGLCLRGKHWRDNRSIHQNIIPARTGACKALGKIIPQVKDKLTGLAFRVPIVNVSVLDISLRLDSCTSVPEIIKCVEKASKSYLHNIIAISDEDAVSSDFIGDSHSCVLDVDSTLQLKPNFFKVVCWYENEYSYACRVVDSIFFSELQFTTSLMLVSKMTYVRPKLAKQQDEVQQTECNFKEISIECHYGEALPKIISTTSTESSLKPKSYIKKYRPLILRKPLALHHSESATVPITPEPKQRSDIFKICDDVSVSKTSARQNRDSLFNSCIALPNSMDENKSLNAKERLEDVKKEFSKMLDITEDLLKKSYSNKIKMASTVQSKESIKAPDAEINGGSIMNTNDIKIIHQQESNKIFKECGDFKDKNLNTSNDSNQGNLCGYITTGLKIIEDGLKDIKQNKTTTEESPTENFLTVKSCKLNENASQIETILTNIVISENSLTTHSSEFEIVVNTPKETFENSHSKELTQISLSDSKISHCSDLKITIDSQRQPSNNVLQEHKPSNHSLDGKLSDHEYNENEVDIKDDGSCNTLSLQKPLIENKPLKTITIDFVKYLENSKEYNMHIIDEELKKRNMILLNLESSPNMDDVYNGYLTKKEGNLHKNEYSYEDLSGLNSLVPKIENVISDDLSRCDSAHYTETTISNGDTKINKLDLYDKLDSASGSGSDNSFQLHERKSHIIQITDLTNSLEDLSRLDKICKIIEISDELSDQLFSNLNNSKKSTENRNNNKWSFNDLCDRIQLDEFCNNVFGKTSV